MVTPFSGGEIDANALRALVERQAAAGVAGVVPCGSTGESATLTPAEHARVVEITVQAARGRVQVIAGAGSNATAEAAAFARHAQSAGADGALLISPYYNKPSQAGIVAHYAAVAAEVSIPLLVYNIPGRTASNITPATFAKLAALPNIAGCKEACGDLNQIAHVIRETPPGFCVLSGDDWAALPVLALGGSGVISTTSNLAPEQMVELVRAWQSGDAARAREIHYQLLPLFDALFCETNPVPVKAALAMQGLISDEVRLPLVPLGDAARQNLRAALRQQGLL